MVQWRPSLDPPPFDWPKDVTGIVIKIFEMKDWDVHAQRMLHRFDWDDTVPEPFAEVLTSDGTVCKLRLQDLEVIV